MGPIVLGGTLCALAGASGCMHPPADEAEAGEQIDDQAKAALLAEAASLSTPGGVIDDDVAVVTSVADATALQASIDRVVAEEFPSLEDMHIEARTGTSSDSLLRTSFRSLDVARRASKRHYFVVLSTAFATQPDAAAIEALVIHEIQHIYDYTQLSGAALLGLVAEYVLSPNSFVPRYERATDIRALERAFEAQRATQAADMIRYRKFLYEVVPAADVAEKHRNYLRPDEIIDCDAQVSGGGPRVAPCVIMTDLSFPLQH
ncbi:MAG: hypothetical protein IPL79_00975 [Myxococcales bacterium]|nr:hypothetical protein [Myxococcales bacterium]